MAFVALYDANVLYPSTLRDLLVSIAQDGLVQAKWTDRILDETFRSLKAKRPDLDPVRLGRTREAMMRAVRDCMVKGYEPLIEALELPDPDDRHVLSAWDVEAKHPDAFIEDQIDLDPAAMYAAVRRIADRWRNPPGTVEDVLGSLERDGMVAAAAALRAL